MSNQLPQNSAISIIDTIIEGLVYVSLVFISFFVIFVSFESFRLPQQTALHVAITLIMALWIVKQCLQGEIKIKIYPAYLPIVIVIITHLLSIFSSENVHVSLREFGLFISIVLFFFILSQQMDSQRYLLSLAVLVLSICTLEATIGIFQYFGLNTKIGLGENYDMFSTLGNKNYVCELLILVLPLSVVFLLLSSNIFIKILCLSNSILLFAVVLLGQTRATWIGAIIGFAAMTFFYLRSVDRKYFKIVAVFFVSIIVLSAVVIFLSDRQIIFKHTKLQFKERVTSILNLQDKSALSRKMIWGGSWVMIKENPIGTGIGIYKIKYLDCLKKYIKEQNKGAIPGYFKDVNAREAHSEYLHTWAEMGPQGLVALLYFMFYLFYIFLKRYRTVNDHFLKSVNLGSIGGLVSIAVAAVFGFPFHIVPTALICAVLVHIIIFISDYAKMQSQPEAKGKLLSLNLAKYGLQPVVLVVVLIFTVYFISISIKPQWANIVLKKANYLAQAAGGEAQAEQSYKASLRLDPYNGDVHLFTGMFYQKTKRHDDALRELTVARHYFGLPQLYLDLGAIYFEVAGKSLAEGRREEASQQYALAEREFGESLAVYPNYAYPVYNLGLIAYQKQNYASAEQYLKKALEIQKDFDVALFKLALVYERKNNIPEAIKYYQETIKYNPNHADANYNLGLLLVNQGRLEEGKTAFARVLEIDPNHIKTLNNLGNILFQQKLYDEAILKYQGAIANDPNYTHPRLNLALAYQQLGRIDDAIYQLEILKTLSLAPDQEAKVYFVSGLCYERKNRLADAFNAFKVVVQKYPNTDMGQKAQNELNKLSQFLSMQKPQQ